MIRSLAFVFLVLMVTGCATVSPNGLYWGKYSSTLYEVKKNPGESSIARHQTELHKIIDVSHRKRLKVPPGLSAELGNIYLKQGKKEKAIIYFNQETATYPESRHFVTTMINNIN